MFEIVVCVKYCKTNYNQLFPFSIYEISALSYALSIKKEKTDICITVISMGPLESEPYLHDLYSIGVDKVILITDSCFAGSDTYATSYILSKTIPIIYDNNLPQMILCGSKTQDSCTGQIGIELSEWLKIDCIGDVRFIDINNMCIICNESRHTIAMTDCVIAIVCHIIDLPLPNLCDIISAKEKSVKRITNVDLSIPSDEVGVRGSLTKVIKVESSISYNKNSKEINGSIYEKSRNLLSLLRIDKEEYCNE